MDDSVIDEAVKELEAGKDPRAVLLKVIEQAERTVADNLVTVNDLAARMGVSERRARYVANEAQRVRGYGRQYSGWLLTPAEAQALLIEKHKA